MTTTTHHGTPLDSVTFPDDVEDDAPAPYDPLAALTVDELAIGSRHLRASLVAQITQTGEQYERALAVVLWLHRRRAERGADLAACTALTFVELQQQLTALAPGGDERPTQPAS